MTLRPNPVLVVMSILIGLTQIAPAQNETRTSPENDKGLLLREIRFGNRELSLPSRLINDKLILTNDGLENDIAHLEGRDQDQDFVRIKIDRLLIDQDKAAIQIAQWFAQVWSNTGNKELQRKLSADADNQFEDADQKCVSVR